jgi:hypothetical protein
MHSGGVFSLFKTFIAEQKGLKSPFIASQSFFSSKGYPTIKNNIFDDSKFWLDVFLLEGVSNYKG